MIRPVKWYKVTCDKCSRSKQVSDYGDIEGEISIPRWFKCYRDSISGWPVREIRCDRCIASIREDGMHYDIQPAENITVR